MAEGEILDVLMVEDNPADAELTIQALRSDGLAPTVQVLRDGAEALDFLAGTGAFAGRDLGLKPRVILLDLKLPKVDGLEVLERLKSDPRTAVIPVVILTSSREERDLRDSYRLGANSYIVKPVDFEKFTEAVRQVGLYWLRLNQLPR